MEAIRHSLASARMIFCGGYGAGYESMNYFHGQRVFATSLCLRQKYINASNFFTKFELDSHLDLGPAKRMDTMTPMYSSNESKSRCLGTDLNVGLQYIEGEQDFLYECGPRAYDSAYAHTPYELLPYNGVSQS